MSIQPGFLLAAAYPPKSPEYFRAKRLEKNWKLFSGITAPPGEWLFTELDATERRIAASVGKERQRRSVADGRQDKFTENCADPERVHILGACGEMAFAKATGRYWGMGIDTFRVGDVGVFEVRTRTDVYHDLKVRKDEPAGRYVVQVYGCLDYRDIGGYSDHDETEQPLEPLPCYRFFVAGYILSDAAKQAQYESDKPGFEDVYLIPQGALRSPELLIVRDWIAHYDMERKAPRPSFRSYNDYTNGDYYPKPEGEIVQIAAPALEVQQNDVKEKPSKKNPAPVLDGFHT